jgi:hypothetical protein
LSICIRGKDTKCEGFIHGLESVAVVVAALARQLHRCAFVLAPLVADIIGTAPPHNFRISGQRLVAVKAFDLDSYLQIVALGHEYVVRWRYFKD